MSKFDLVFKYTLFACVATLFNLSAQYVSLHFYRGLLSLYLAIFWGTAIGLMVKFILDKKYIFYYQAKSKFHDLKSFILYSGTGVVTTIIFWGFELSFDWLFRFGSAKFLGAVIGLAIGYFLKYNLDKKFVFSKLNEQ